MTNKLIVALDVDTRQRAIELCATLRGLVGMFKIGMQLFTATGPDLVREVISQGNQVFLDLKYHDIPNTVAMAGVEATRLGVSIFNIHASGGSEMMRRTAEAVSECAQREGIARPKVIAVTALTSVNAVVLNEIGYSTGPAEQVTRFALLAESAGMDGVVASPQEIAAIRVITQPNFLIVTPGVRPSGADLFDQKRVTTPKEAIRAGADYIVVGRPVLEASNPVRAVQQILDEIDTSAVSQAAI